MRIISTLVILLAIGTASASQALAAETTGTDETNTNANIQTNILAFAVNPYALDAKPALDPEIQKRDEALAKYAERLKNAVFPQGQFTINASAYTASADECGNDKGITASGLKVKENRTLACPPQFPFGTKINIEGQGTFVCEDRGGAIKGNHFDIYVQTKGEAFAFGRRNLIAQVVLD